MGKNTQDRQEFIIDNLRIEMDEASEDIDSENKDEKDNIVEEIQAKEAAAIIWFELFFGDNTTVGSLEFLPIVIVVCPKIKFGKKIRPKQRCIIGE